MIAVHCEYCGKEIGQAKFCRYCGKKVLPPVTIEPWKQSMPFSVLGLVLSTALILFFQTQGLTAWICSLLYAAVSALWFSMLPNKVEQNEERCKRAREQREDYKPDPRFVSCMNCLCGWAFGFVANKGFERGELGKWPKVISAITVGGCVLTAIVGFSVGFLNVVPAGHFMMRSTVPMESEKNEQGTAVYSLYDGQSQSTVLFFEPDDFEISSQTLDQMGEWYSDFGWQPDDEIQTDGTARGNDYIMRSFVDDEGYYDRIIIVYLQGKRGESFEMRFFYPAGSPLSSEEQQQDVLSFLEAFQPL